VSARVRVLVWHRAAVAERDAVGQAYHEISGALAGTPGLLANELLHARGDRASFVVMSEWESLAAFEAWERGAAHRGTTAPLRRYRDTSRPVPFEVYEVTGGVRCAAADGYGGS
jgi:heme-degrading monooxygenase HmoA